MSIGAGIACLLLALIPPLTEAQQTRLATAYDGRDHREEAFVALLENARAYAPDSGGDPARVAGDAPVRLHPDPAALIADPEPARGRLYRIDGTLAQSTPLAAPHEGVREWFVRDEEGRPVIVFVAGLGAAAESAFVTGDAVSIYARFYKRVDARARDGTARRYAAFVGAMPWSPAPAAAADESPAGAIALIAGLVLVLAVVFGGVVVLARRTPPRPRPHSAGAAADREPVDEGGSLPDDPADALAELRRRAEADE